MENMLLYTRENVGTVISLAALLLGLLSEQVAFPKCRDPAPLSRWWWALFYFPTREHNGPTPDLVPRTRLPVPVWKFYGGVIRNH